MTVVRYHHGTLRQEIEWLRDDLLAEYKVSPLMVDAKRVAEGLDMLLTASAEKDGEPVEEGASA